MELKLIPFSTKEKQKKYKINTFTELNITINMLNEVNNFNKIPSGNFYKFGLILNDNLYWYFNGNAVADNREKMREIYTALNQVVKEGQVFAYKLKKR